MLQPYDQFQEPVWIVDRGKWSAERGTRNAEGKQTGTVRIVIDAVVWRP